jgi:hypothetical protein
VLRDNNNFFDPAELAALDEPEPLFRMIQTDSKWGEKTWQCHALPLSVLP